MKICFLSLTHRYDYPRILNMEANSLDEAGHVVTIVSPGGNCEFNVDGIKVKLFPRPAGFKGRLIGSWHLFKTAFLIDSDCYHCNEIESWLIGLLLKFFKKSKFVVFDVKEHYSSRFDEPHIKVWIKIVFKPLLLIFFRFLPQWTDFFIFAKKGAAIDFPKKVKQEYIFNYSQTSYSDRKYSDVPEKIKKLYEGSPVAVHIGGFSKNRGWPQALKALSLMKNSVLQLYCIGTISEGVEIFMKEAKLLGVDNRVKCFDRINFSEMFDHLLCANIGCMLYQPGILNHTYAFPMKLYDYMLAGIPVVGPEFSIEVEPVINGEKIGYCVDTSDPQSIANALDLLCSDTEVSKKMGERARDAALTKYNWSNEAIKLKNVYEKIESKLNGRNTAA